MAEFAGRRLGAQAVENLIGPFLTGVYAGDERELGAEAVFGSLVELERRYGSIAIGGLLQALLRRGERGLRGSYSAAEGMGPFARHLAGRLNESPALGATVSELRREGSAWHLSLSSAAGPDLHARLAGGARNPGRREREAAEGGSTPGPRSFSRASRTPRSCRSRSAWSAPGYGARSRASASWFRAGPGWICWAASS